MNSKQITKTFQFNGLTLAIHPEVYDPAEDTFQLLESLEVQRKTTVLELGTGCGIIALDCARHGAHVICTDINPHAITLTRYNIRMNSKQLTGTIDVRKGDLFSPIRKRETFDVVIFNPPYLPTRPNEQIDGWFDRAVNGGADGLKVTKRFLEHVSPYLTTHGVAYVIVSSLSDQEKFSQYLADNNLHATVASQRRYDDEVLTVYRLVKQTR